MPTLAERRQAGKDEQAAKGKLPDGQYAVRLQDWVCKKSKKGLDMFMLTWKIKEKGEHKGKNRRTYYVLSKSFSINPLLDLLAETGADLSKYSCDNDLQLSEAIEEILEAVEEAKQPSALMTVETREGKDLPEITISDIEKVLGEEEAKEEEAEEEEPEEDDDESPVVPD